MTNESKAIDLVGLARRAGKLTLGAGATEGALDRGRVCALVLALDLSPRSAEKLKEIARSRGIPQYSFGSKAEFGRRFGREEVGILGILDPSLALAVKKQLESPSVPRSAAAGASAQE